jgi:uncharacterized 2Fe-2S/4Fe-4S cluster protein (DUF4445 family)
VNGLTQGPSEICQIQLLPQGTSLSVSRGAALQDLLFAHGVEFPCGGRGRCKGCRVKVIGGDLPITEEDRQKLVDPELAEGWRLACRARVPGDLKLELAQWEETILSDDSVFQFSPKEGLGIAIDLGTTTIVAQLLDLLTGRVLGVRTALNSQAKHGADIMSRIEFATTSQGLPTLHQLTHEQIGNLIDELLAESRRSEQTDAGVPGELKSIVLVGNTVMHHLFCGIDLEPLSHYPFEPVRPGLQIFSASTLGWSSAGEAQVHFLPCLGGFVGSDILAGLLACQIHKSDSLTALIDLGTNGEIVLGNRHRMLCISTAAGPAFEGARISMGMRAASGAISEVHVEAGQFQCHVLGKVPPRGICGSGLVDAVAAALDLGLLKSSGRLVQGDSLSLSPPVSLNQWDIRELQLAKGAIAAGVEILLNKWGEDKGALKQVYLAGAFGNYINYASARRIGLLDFAPQMVKPAGNTALLGAKMALFELEEHGGAYPEILAKAQHVSLKEDPHFQDAFVDHMSFPEK